jgi:Fe-coproporphyrin III synthase
MNDASLLRSLPVLTLNPYNRCNCRCVMCDIWRARGTQMLGIEDLERQTSDIETLGVRQIVFSGGEPLLHADLCGLSDHVRKRGVATTVLTAGLLLEENAHSLAWRTDAVIVSLDGPPQVHDRIRRVAGAFQRMAAGIRALHAEKPGYPVGARCTVQRLNHSLLRETTKTAVELGLQSISFLAADVTSTAFNRPAGWSAARQSEVSLDETEASELEEEIERLIGILPGYAGFVLETPEKLRRIGLHYRAQLGLSEPVAPRCNAPWVSAVIASDGAVRPCFFHKAVGSIGRQTLAEVINGREAVEFRRALDVSQDLICRRCVCSLYLQ